MSTSPNNLSFNQALELLPDQFRKRIITSFLELKNRQLESSLRETYDLVGLSVGKFCESVLRFLQYELTGINIPFGKHIQNFYDECYKLINLPNTSGLESLRVIIPRALIFLYTIRGKRGIGHVGGDIEANQIDMETIVRICDWIICELIRIFHNIPIEDAQAMVDSLATKRLPIVWEINGSKRLLDTTLTYKQKVILLLYTSLGNSALFEELFQWSEHSNQYTFRKDILRPLHKSKIIEYDEVEEIVFLSPIGIQEVENLLLNK